ncbi:MAG TPA: peptide chain release factor N(5)-glutamine methyltransferase [Terriglobales bacterium]|nr:peptide chain release factor N(5)-glutamine methyltransferase [Terriglobales bacterium]
MDIKTALSEAIEQLRGEPIGPPRMAAETLMMHVLGRDRAFVIAHPEHNLDEADAATFRDAVERRAKGEPLQYITGHQEFWGLDFVVSPAVLIPRPETEHLVEAAVNKVRTLQWPKPRIVDVGTGSGCIALAIKSSLPDADVHAVDISWEALGVSQKNADRLGLYVEFAQSDLLSAFREPAFDVIVSNPPYVGRQEWDKVQREVREHEPDVAVFAGEHGIEIYRRLIPEAHAALKPNGWLMMEIGYSMEEAVLELMRDWEEVSSIPDLQGIPRVIVGRRA